MPSVEQILKDSGFTDAEIGAMDRRAVTAFGGVLSAAEQARQDNISFYDNQIAPSLVAWDEEKTRIENEKARLASEAAFYRTQNEAARGAGFVPTDAPGFQPSRDQSGRYISGAPGSTPGSPTFFDVNKIYERAGDAVSVVLDVQAEHQRLFGAPLPINPSQLIKEADRMRLDPRAYAERTYNFEGKRQELQAAQAKAHDDAIRREATTERDKYWSERTGSNPDTRMPSQNLQMTEIARATRAGKLPDPLMLGENERRQATRQAIRTELSEAS